MFRRRFVTLHDAIVSRRLTSVARSGSVEKLLTPGDFDVVSIEAVDKKSGWLLLHGRS